MKRMPKFGAIVVAVTLITGVFIPGSNARAVSRVSAAHRMTNCRCCPGSTTSGLWAPII